ncbi:FimV/HubP family polar landmark protein [Halomonas sp.]|uniref:FimV/HubP family polar landmark protein n=1 Tax=Halomonas sp. TaxID=1486246 RepID=UPI003850DB90
MKRKLTLAMLLSLSAASPMALALGIGDADVRSTLNAPLRATLPLTDAAGIQAGLLNVSVADERAFVAAGLPRTPLAASVRLSVEQRQGRLVVDLTTERPVREPWMDLLLRFDWPGGQQLREVTLLLDPPDYDQMPALVVGSRPLASAPVSVSAPSPRDAAPAQVAAPRPSAAPARSGDPTMVRSGDTLWAIAGRLRPDSGISMNQMMVSLVEANPEAFPSGNINAMRAGFSLVVPSREAIAARSGDDAGRIVAEMNRAWANRGGGAPARVAMGSPSASQTASVAVAPTDAAVSSPQAVSPSPGDETSAESPEASEPGDADAPLAESEESLETPRLTLLTDAQVAAEAAFAGEGSDEEDASGAISDNSDDNDMGDGLDEAGETSGSSRVMVDSDLLAELYGDGELTSDERLVRLESQWLERRDTLEAVQGERDQLQEDLSEMRDELAALREQLASLAAGGVGMDGPGAGGMTAPGGSSGERPWWGAIYQGDVDRNLMLGGAGLAALLALWVAVRRRRRENSGSTAGEAGTVRVAVPGAQAPGQHESASLAPAVPAAPSVQGSLPQAEAISEADIFMAYGRYDQARELLEANLAREPERDDLRLKLLNVHLEQGSREEAEREAVRLRDGDNPAVRDEVERLLTRYGLASAATGASVAAVAAGERAVFNKPAELPPRMFDDTTGPESDSPDQASEDERQSDKDTAGAVHVSNPAHKGPEAAAYRRPESMDEPSTPPDEAPTPKPVKPEPVNPEPVKPEPVNPEPVKPEASEVATRRLEDGREIIDYRPPTLNPSPAPREETPMQPGIDFSSDDLGLAEKGAGFDDGASLDRPEAGDDDAVDEALPHEWEVEEVSFPSLEADNDNFSSSAAPESLAEARRRVEAGDGGRARELLNELKSSDDPAIRDEAVALLRRLDA